MSGRKSYGAGTIDEEFEPDVSKCIWGPALRLGPTGFFLREQLHEMSLEFRAISSVA